MSRWHAHYAKNKDELNMLMRYILKNKSPKQPWMVKGPNKYKHMEE
jgi:hypothetical protein